VQTCLALVEAMSAAGRGAATIDVALVALGAALGLPRGAAAGLFAVGRCAGWVAHVLEQYAAGYLVRPRARHPRQVGDAP
jgi:citrate synthase